MKAAQFKSHGTSPHKELVEKPQQTKPSTSGNDNTKKVKHAPLRKRLLNVLTAIIRWFREQLREQHYVAERTLIKLAQKPGKHNISNANWT